MGCGHLWALDVHLWAVVVINGGGSSMGSTVWCHSVGGCGCVGCVHLCVGGRGLWVLIVDEGWWWVMVVLLSLSSLVVLLCGRSLW